MGLPHVAIVAVNSYEEVPRSQKVSVTSEHAPSSALIIILPLFQMIEWMGRNMYSGRHEISWGGVGREWIW